MLDKLKDEWSRSPTLAGRPTYVPILTGMDGAFPESGPILANQPGVQSVDQAERWYRARATAAYMSAMRGKFVWITAVWVFIVGVLALARYPTPRVLALAATLAASMATFVVWLSRNCSCSVPRVTSAQSETLQTLPRFLLMFVALGLTGGVRSPLLLATLVTAGAWHTRYALLLTRTVGESACQLGRAREEMVYRAVARAREMEQIGLKLSHELKNPLAAIKGLVQLSARAACDPDSAEQLRVVAAEVDRMETILKEYLSFSRPVEALQPKRVALGELADEVLSLMDARAATAGVRLRRRGDAVIEADPRRLKDALFNLVGNAVEATPQGGRVEVEIDEVERAARIAVRDSGRGMPPEVLDRIGTPFFTTRDEGTGLGVVVARATFAQHGGSLVYSSEPGQGTTAMGTLPIRSVQGGDGFAGAGRRP